jgi:hypothetical protein
MAAHSGRSAVHRRTVWLLAVAASLPMASAGADSAPGAGIYSCIDSNGRKLTSDRPIAECTAKEQLMLNRDGSVKAVLPPTLTAEERAEKEARERAAAEARAAQADAVRRDRNLMARYPTEAAHNRARSAALENVKLAMKASELRLRELAAERKPLLDEAEFYRGKPLPGKLRAALEANDASNEAQRASMATQEAEAGRVNRLFDAELERLRRLWSGAAPGSMGSIAAGTAGRAALPASTSANGDTPAGKTPSGAAGPR